MSENANPYVKMPKEVLEQHLQQFGEAIKVNSEAKNLNLLQAFGSIVSDEDKNKISNHASLTSEIANLRKDGNIGSLSAVEQEFADSNLQDAISKIKEIDPNFPISSVLNNDKLNVLEKVRAMKPLTEGAIYAASSIKTIKDQLPIRSVTEPALQSFASPDSTSDEAMTIVNEIGSSLGMIKKQ